MIVGFAVNTVVFGVSFAFALYFQRVLLFSITETGIAFVPFAFMVTAANVVGGWAVSRLGFRVPVSIGLAVAAVGCVLSLMIDRNTSYLAILPGQLFIRLGIGVVIPALTTSILAVVPPARSGVASGALNAVRQTGGAFGVAMFGAFMAGNIVLGIRAALVASCVLLLGTALLACVGMRNSERVRSVEPESAK
jgi:MFS transporter, DHA2 family, methylenomycin A resistance protein